MFIIQFVNGV